MDAIARYLWFLLPANPMVVRIVQGGSRRMRHLWVRMGYLGVKTMVAVLRGEKVAPVMDTGVGFVTKANFNSPEMAEIVKPPLDKYLK